MNVLVLNGGSSGIKAQIRELPDGGRPLWRASADWGREPGAAELRIDGAVRTMQIGVPAEVLGPVIEAARDCAPIDAVGHRVVHGGRSFREPVRITPDVLAEIARLGEFAPEHNCLEADGIKAAEQALGRDIPQVAVFDTAFHATMPEAAVVYPGPYEWVAQGIRRYGFHGISHQYVSRRAAEILKRPLAEPHMITCHLGNGCSLAAVREGKCVDTTMGFTPLEGLMMGTRSGTIDPGIVIYLVRHCGYAADALDRILNKESGLKGISGVSGDMRAVIEAKDAGHARAKLAFDIFIHRLCREAGAMAASLDRVDALVFTAGIGENSAVVRESACGGLKFLGVRLDDGRNQAAPVDADIAAPDSAVRVLVVRTEEDAEIARECYRVVVGG